MAGNFDSSVNGWLGKNLLPSIIAIGVAYLGTVTTGINTSLKEMQASIQEVQKSQAVLNANADRTAQDIEDIYRMIEAQEARLRSLETGRRLSD